MKEPRDFGLSGGDIGVIAIAIVFALCGLYLMIGPSPFASLYAAKPPAPQQEEVTIDLKTYKPPPMPE